MALWGQAALLQEQTTKFSNKGETMILTGTIVKAVSGFYYVEINGSVYECRARGVFRNNKLTPLVGDHCEMEMLEASEQKGNVVKLLERKNAFVRPPVANIDQMGIVFAAAAPDPIPFLIDKLTVVAEHHHIKPFLIMNKTDLSSELAEHLPHTYQLAGYRVFCVSAAEQKGIEALKEQLQNQVTVFAGCSGVGKSSLLNLLGSDIRLETGGVSRKIQRGRHTTRTVELFSLGDNTFVADSPGFSSLDIQDIRVTELEACFPELHEYIGKCRFRGCSHISEPDCAVREALAQGKIARSRYESYVQMYQILKEIKEWQR